MIEIEKILAFAATTDLALLGFGQLEDSAGLLVSYSLMLLFFSHGFWFLNSRLWSDGILHEAAYSGAPPNYTVHKLTDSLDRRSEFAASLTVATALSAVACLTAGLLDQFIDAELAPSISAGWVLAVFGASFVLLTSVWLKVWLSLRVAIADVEAKESSV